MTPDGRSRQSLRALLIGFALLAAVPAASARDLADVARRLLAAYPEALAGSDGTVLVWRDGARMPLDDGRGAKPFAAWLAEPDIEDMLAVSYPAGPPGAPPGDESDPGRARNAAFFAHMYGDCRKGEVEPHLAAVAWLPRKGGQRLRVTRINGVAEKLAAVSRELDELPAEFDAFLLPAAGGYTCRAIAGTGRLSAHAYGIAVDIAARRTHYWRWAGTRAGRPPPYRNAVPWEIVRVFEKHGFIWGGRWYHFDTMHFEYRPELLVPAAP